MVKRSVSVYSEEFENGCIPMYCGARVSDVPVSLLLC